MREIAPCKDCENRVLGCHSSCEKYQEFRKAKDLDNAAKRTVWQDYVSPDFVSNQDFLSKIYSKSNVFSNGTEYEIFLDNYCNKCRHGKLREDGFPEFPEQGGCPIWDAMENARFDASQFPSDDILEVRDRDGNVLSWHHCCRFIDKEVD